MRRLSAVTLTSAVILAVTAPVAVATETAVTTFADLEAAANAAECLDDDVITLSANIIDTGALAIDCDLTLDLSGHALALGGITVGATTTLTVTDSTSGGTLDVNAPDGDAAIVVGADGALVIEAGTVTATGGKNGAGIAAAHATVAINGGTTKATGGLFGAGIAVPGGTLGISGGSVTARGAANAPGMGGARSTVTIAAGTVRAYGGDKSAGIGSGTVIITGGTIEAVGGLFGAGIGGDQNRSGGTISIAGAHVTARGGDYGAGIGGGRDGAGGTITVDGGTVLATGGQLAAGIGGGASGSSGSITVTGGSVEATGGRLGAGIGAGDRADANTITIDGGTVTASGGDAAAGIGGGNRGDGATVTIGLGATVTASGGQSAVGAGAAFSGSEFGSLTLAGTLHVPSGELVIPDSNTSGAEVVIESTGRLLGIAGDETAGATVTGAGQIDNAGVIALDESLVQVAIEDHNYLLDFDTQGGTDPADVRVFASTFDTGYRTLPDAPVGTAWNTATDGTGTWFAASTAVTSDTSLHAVGGAALLAHELTTATGTCTDGDTLSLDSDKVVDVTLDITCDLTLNLNGHTLDVDRIAVASGSTLSVTDTSGGALYADGALADLAGINVPPGAGLIVESGYVKALGGDRGAGIGGNAGQSAGTVTISGGEVWASGLASGIGGGSGQDGGSGGVVTITGGIVHAAGGTGIGGAYGWQFGHSGDGGTVVIGEGATVTATGSDTAIGPGSVANPGGSLTLAGTLYVPHGLLRVDRMTMQITPTGRLLGAEGDESRGGMLSASDGTVVENHGVIALEEALVAASVDVNNFLVTFAVPDGSAPSPVRVFAPTFDAGFRTLPSAGAGLWWNTADDGTGEWFTTASAVTADTTVHAVTDAILTISAPGGVVAQGDTATFVVTGVDHLGNPIDLSGVTLTSSVPTDVVDGLTVQFPHASPHEITATLGTASATVVVEVQAALPQTGPDGSTAIAGGIAAMLMAAGIALVSRRRLGLA